MKKILDNVYLLKSTFSISNQFIITFKDFVVLIDTGLRGNTNNILSSIQSLGFKIDDLKYIFITHSDGDHIGSLYDLKDQTKAIVLSSNIEKIAIEKGESSRELKSIGFSNVFYHAISPLFKAEPSKVDEILTPGTKFDDLDGLEVINSIGHTPGHLSFYLKKGKILFSGDSINIKGPLLKPSSGVNCWDEIKSNESFKKQLKMSPNYICGGHGVWKKV